MAIGKFPFEFSTLNGKRVRVTTKDASSFELRIMDRNKAIAEFSWTPLPENYRDTKIRMEKDWSSDKFEAIQGFWAIYND